MTAALFDFPDSMRQQWLVFERILRDASGIADGDPAELEYCLQAIKPAFLRAAQPKTFDASGDGDALVHAINTWVQDLTGALLMELLFRHIELYRLRGNQPAAVLALATPLRREPDAQRGGSKPSTRRKPDAQPEGADSDRPSDQRTCGCTEKVGAIQAVPM